MIQRLISFLLVAAALLTASGCDKSPTSVPVKPAQNPAEFRIVSLSPAITQMIIDLGHGDQIVAVIENDPAAPPKAAVFPGSYDNPTTESIMQFKPTHVFTEIAHPPDRLVELGKQNQFIYRNYTSPHNIDDLVSILVKPEDIGATIKDSSGLAAALGNFQDGIVLTRIVGAKLDAIREATAGQSRRPRVLMVIGTDPLMVSGRKTINNELLTYCNAWNAAGAAEDGAPVLDAEAVRAMNPDVILFLMPGAPKLGPIETDSRLAIFRGMDVPAVTNKRLHLIDDPLVLLPSTSAPQTAKLMAQAIYPDLKEKIEAAVKNARPPKVSDSETAPAATQPNAGN